MSIETKDPSKDIGKKASMKRDGLLLPPEDEDKYAEILNSLDTPTLDDRTIKWIVGGKDKSINQQLLMSALIDAPKNMNKEERSKFGDSLIEAFLNWAPDPTTSMLIEQQKYLYSGPKGK